MRLDPAVHCQRNYRIRELAHDFELLDVWAFPIEAASSRGETFPAFVETVGGVMAHQGGSGTSRLLFVLRDRLGDLFGWDRDVNTLPIPGCSENSLRDRLTLSEQQEQPWYGQETKGDKFTFKPVFTDASESIAELSNGTVHAAVHFSWVPMNDDHSRPELAVYVKHRGRLGRAYMSLIKPFRHWVVYPALMRQAREAWLTRYPA